MRLIFISLFASAVSAAPVILPDWNFQLSDVRDHGLSKEVLFTNMDRDMVKIGASICSNRALMWAHDFKRHHNLYTAKIFLFYTKKKGKIGRKTWWYHVTPIINEDGNLWTMDAGFPKKIKSPLTIPEWLNKFVGTTSCKEIRAGEFELIDYIFREKTFPETTTYGTHDCYIGFAPEGYWTPESFAMGLGGKNGSGRPVSYSRPEIDIREVLKACTEASTGFFGQLTGKAEKKCKKFYGIADE